MDRDQRDERDEDPLRSGQPQRLGRVGADELDEEPEDAGREEVELERPAGDGHAVAWGCDLSAEYVRINAEYMT